MNIGVMLAPLFQSPGDAGTLEAAFAIAKRFGSHVDVLFAQPDPTDTIPLFGEDTSPDTVRRLRETAIAAAEQQRLAARKTFDQACEAGNIPLANCADIAAGQPSAAWTDVTGRSEDFVARKALLSDLVVFWHDWRECRAGFPPNL